MATNSGVTGGILRLSNESQQPQGEMARLLLSFVAANPESIIVTDADLDGPVGPRIEYANRAALDHTRYAEEGDLIGQPLSMLYTPEAFPQIIRDLRESIRTARTIRHERQKLALGGQLHWMEIETMPVAGADGRITRFIRAGRNITMRKRMEMLREGDERLLATVLRVTREAMVVIAGTGHIALANAAFTRQFGWPGAEVVSTLWQDYLVGSDPDRVMGEITSTAGGPIREVMAGIRQIDGVPLTCRLIVNTVRQPDNLLYYVLIVSPHQPPDDAIFFEDSRQAAS